jgi:hypothetical protein
VFERISKYVKILASREHRLKYKLYKVYLGIGKSKSRKTFIFYFVLTLLLFIPFIPVKNRSKTFYEPDRPDIPYYLKETIEFYIINETDEIISYSILFFFVDNEEMPSFPFSAQFDFSETNIVNITEIKGWYKIDKKFFDVEVKTNANQFEKSETLEISFDIPILSLESGQKLEIGYSYKAQRSKESIESFGRGIVWPIYKEEFTPFYWWPLGRVGVLDVYFPNKMSFDRVTPKKDYDTKMILIPELGEKISHTRILLIGIPKMEQMELVFYLLDSPSKPQEFQGEDVGCLTDSIDMHLEIQEGYYLVNLSLHVTNPSTDPAYVIPDPFCYFLHFKEKQEIVSFKTENGSCLFFFKEEVNDMVIETYKRTDGLPILGPLEDGNIHVKAMVPHENDLKIKNQILYPKFMLSVLSSNTQIKFEIEVPEDQKIFRGYPQNYVYENDRKIWWGLSDPEAGDILYFVCVFGKNPSIFKELWIFNKFNLYFILALWIIVTVVCYIYQSGLKWVIGFMSALTLFSWQFFYSKVDYSEIFYIKNYHIRFLLHSLYLVPIFYIISIFIILLMLKWNKNPLRNGEEEKFQLKYDIFSRVIRNKEELNLWKLKGSCFFTGRQIEEILEEFALFFFDEEWNDVFIIHKGVLKLR